VPKGLVEIFYRKLASLDRIREKQESNFSRHQIGIQEVEEIYGAVFLNAIASFEGYLEELFIGLLVGKICKSHCNVRIRVKSDLVAREVIFRDKRYINWLPYRNTKEMAGIFFTGGRPFTLLTQDEEEHLNKCSCIRNAIAHQSRHAVDLFKSEILKGLTLGPRDRRPKSLLRCQFSLNPPINYYQQYIGRILTIANKIY